MRNIGNVVWVPVPEYRQIERQCPDCLGTARWHCTLPNGEQFDVECPRCYPGGIAASTGVIREDYETVVKVGQLAIVGIDTADGLRYTTENRYSFKESDVFDTEDQAKARAAEIGEEHVRNESARMARIAKNKGRPQRGPNGERQPADFDGIQSVVYAKSQIRRAMKDAKNWARFAATKGVKVDLAEMLAKELQVAP
jgi:hypothetical protein